MDESLGGVTARIVKKPLAAQLRLWIPTILILLLCAVFLVVIARDPNLQWREVGTYLFNREVLGGVIDTIELTAICAALGGTIGVGLAAMRMSQSQALRSLAAMYSWIVRSIPPLVQLIFWFNMALIFPRIWWPLSPTGSVGTNSVITGFAAAIIGLSLNEAAFVAEIVRGGISSVPAGEIEAARALGMTSSQIFRQITLPQAFRVALPPLGNQVIALTKLTSLVAFIGGQDLLGRVTSIYSTNYKVVPLLLVASIWYLLMVTVLSGIQMAVERRWFAERRGKNRERLSYSGDPAGQVGAETREVLS